ncbi:fumarylacetoacetate hydrolase family protein, putative [Synechococcus sp. PCC 7335]|uniref:fumarylacetoacetate hydrolase family protein n=1 Tax=Synechococcus sp. (strain ATCC 29403 / PCC 7335) TaxID=91464 RepID=UPI00017EE74A|nr:fumarylacetoacetate hydrolase family protein [Synechococcus sp. PCC 7335]EDX83742.1 fumarylacetoacetate hydrolase family protein, putative [Synechococcus sp. PCC 7335]
MAHRYVRVQSSSGQLHYGLLQADRGVKILDAPPWRDGRMTELELAIENYTLLAPCAPSKVVAVGRNYAQHAAELGNEVPKEPLLFMKPPTAVTAADMAIYYPSQSERVDYEGELAVIIGNRTKDCEPTEARSKIWGYTIANDVTARDLQKRDGQWTRAKGFDSFCPLGPWIVREIPAGARLQTFVNDAQLPKQSATIANMIFSPEYLVSYISQAITLLPGDVVLTGTPAGVGPVNVGDRIRIEIEGIGSLENTVQTKTKNEAPTSKEMALQ